MLGSDPTRYNLKYCERLKCSWKSQEEHSAFSKSVVLNNKIV